VFVRISTEQESIDRFNDAIVTAFDYNVSYVQIFEYDGNLYMFTRERINPTGYDFRWAYKISEDMGQTWSEETALVVADVQYYIQLTETNTPGTLLMLCYSNPAFSETDIRASYLHLDTMRVYKTDDTTLIGTTSIDFNDIPIAVSPASGNRLRLYNGAKTDVGDVKFLFSEFEYTANSVATYKVYDNGGPYNIASAGNDLLASGSHAQLGVAWIGTDRIAVARGYEGSDYLAIYSYDSQTHTATKTTDVASSDRTNGVRVARPMVDQLGKAMVFWKGYFNPAVYTDFFADGRICLIDGST
jgi:hypothetical protein